MTNKNTKTFEMYTVMENEVMNQEQRTLPDIPRLAEEPFEKLGATSCNSRLSTLVGNRPAQVNLRSHIIRLYTCLC